MVTTYLFIRVVGLCFLSCAIVSVDISHIVMVQIWEKKSSKMLSPDLDCPGVFVSLLGHHISEWTSRNPFPGIHRGLRYSPTVSIHSSRSNHREGSPPQLSVFVIPRVSMPPQPCGGRDLPKSIFGCETSVQTRTHDALNRSGICSENKIQIAGTMDLVLVGTRIHVRRGVRYVLFIFRLLLPLFRNFGHLHQGSS